MQSLPPITIVNSTAETKNGCVGGTKTIYPQMTQMHADIQSFFRSASICVICGPDSGGLMKGGYRRPPTVVTHRR